MSIATDLMTERSAEYLNNTIKGRCNEKVWDDKFENYYFIAQCFDDIQHEVMSEIYGQDYYNPSEWASDDVENDYEKTCDIRSDFTNQSFEYIKDIKETAKPDEWDS